MDGKTVRERLPATPPAHVGSAAWPPASACKCAAYLSVKEAELRHDVALALSTISPLYNSGRDDDTIKQQLMQQFAPPRLRCRRLLLPLTTMDGVNLMLGVALIFLCALVLSFSEARVSDAKLTLLARKVVRSQEEERAYLSRKLHDGTGQTLVAVKLLIEGTPARTASEGPRRAQRCFAGPHPRPLPEGEGVIQRTLSQ
jgi:signal transduction histidine kinase